MYRTLDVLITAEIIFIIIEILTH